MAILKPNIEQSIVIDCPCWGWGLFKSTVSKFYEIWFSLGGWVGFFVVEFSGECFERPRPWDSCSVVMGKCGAI